MPIYAGDRSFDDMLYGKMVYARVPRAKIHRIDTSEAQKAEGVVKVATCDDIPAQKVFGILQEQQQILAREEVFYAGDPVAVVYAETLQVAEEAAKLVKVDMTELPGIFSTEDAKAAPEPFAHGDKVLSHTKVRRGDTAKGFQEADVIMEEDFRVPFVEHAYLEPECGLSHMKGGHADRVHRQPGFLPDQGHDPQDAGPAPGQGARRGDPGRWRLRGQRRTDRPACTARWAPG